MWKIAKMVKCCDCFNAEIVIWQGIKNAKLFSILIMPWYFIAGRNGTGIGIKPGMGIHHLNIDPGHGSTGSQRRGNRPSHNPILQNA